MEEMWTLLSKDSGRNNVQRKLITASQKLLNFPG
jgi:hypothetical protein